MPSPRSVASADTTPSHQPNAWLADDSDVASVTHDDDVYDTQEKARALAKKLMLANGSPPALQLWAHDRTAANTLQFGGVQLLTTDPKMSLRYFDAALTLAADAESLYWQAWAHAELRQFHQAIESLNTCVTRKRKFADAFCLRGIMYAKLGLHRAARRDYDRALKQEPTALATRMHRGLSRLADEDFPGALADLEAARKSHEVDEGYFVGLAQTYLHLNKPAQAHACLKEAFELGFDDDNLQRVRRHAEARLRQKG